MVHKPKKCFGKATKVTCIIKYLHPSRLISSTFPNTSTANHRLDGCIVVMQDSKVVHRKEKLVIIIHHEDFKTTDGEPEDLYINNRGRVIESDLANLNDQIQIDDDNSPAPENIPSSEDSGTNEIFSSGWGHDGVCYCCQAEGHTTEAKLFNFGSFAGVPTLKFTNRKPPSYNDRF